MTDTHAFVTQLDHLVRLLAEQPAELDDQKIALHQMRAALDGGDVAIVAAPDGLYVNGVAEGGPPAAPDGLRGRMETDGVRRLDVARAATAADLLVAARALATAGGLAWLDLEAVRASASPAAARPTPVGVGAVAAGVGDDADLVTALPRPARPAARAGPAAGRYIPPGAPPRAPAVGRLPDLPPLRAPRPSGAAEGIVNRSEAAGDEAVLLRPTPTHAERELDTRDLVARLAEVRELRAVNVVLEEVTGRVERAVRGGDAVTLRDALAALVRHEAVETRQDVRLAARITLRRLITPLNLRLVAGLLPRQPDRREETLDALRGAPIEGADAVMEHLIAADSASDRRAFYSALVKLPADEAVLVHMLGDPRWFVVRNAAELAADLRLRGADAALVGALAHEDARVRRSAAAALGRLATPAAVEALRGMLGAEERAVRATAAVALADARWPHAAATVRGLLDEERDLDARHAMLAALGRVATDEAVEILVGWSVRGRGLFRRTPSATRLAAVQALVDAGTDTARIALRTLARDRNREIAVCAQTGVRGDRRLREA